MIFKKLGNSTAVVSAIGQGCMGIGGQLTPDMTRDREYVDALRLGIDLGMTFIDTAEVYGNGYSEEIVGQAIGQRRHAVFVASKVSPEHNGYRDVLQAAERSLARLGTDYLDLYQVHWPNPAIPVAETMKAMEKLATDGKVRHVGVSNFSVADMKAAAEAIPGLAIASNQVEYNLFDRFVEKRILPHCLAESITLIAYSPLDKGRTGNRDAILDKIGQRHGRTPAQIALNWLICQPGVIVIPKAANPAHVRDNAAAADFSLTDEECREIAEAFSADPALIPVDAISVSVEGEGARKVYQTLDEALRNDLKFTPSPRELAEDIQKGEPIKPVRLVKGKADREKFDLVEGRIRYWAWVIAHGGKLPIPALIRT
jgi:diketogulonate reductase-like aldo/keto reductase